MAKSKEGKARSAQNSTKHGMLSKRCTILVDETREEYEETRTGWLKNYEPADYHDARALKRQLAERPVAEAPKAKSEEAGAESCIPDSGAKSSARTKVHPPKLLPLGNGRWRKIGKLIVESVHPGSLELTGNSRFCHS